jgi:hypothetical protein
MADENAITWRLGVDRSQLTAGMSAAQADTLAASQRIAQGMGHAAEGGEKIFTSSHRAAGQIRILGQELARGAEAGDLFASGLEAAERVLRLPLGSLAVLAAAGILIKQLHDVAEADEKLKRQLATSLKPSAIDDYSAAVETLAERYKNTADAIAASTQRITNPTVMQKFSDFIKNIFTPTGPRGDQFGAEPGNQGPLASETSAGETRGTIAEAQQQQTRRLELEINEIRKQGVDVEKKIYDLKLAASQVELDALKKAFPKDEDQTQAKFQAQSAIDTLKAEKQRTEEKEKQKESAEKQAEFEKERFGLSLKELAEGRGGSPQTEHERRQARRAVGERAESERLRLRGDEEGARVHVERAQQIESGIQGLKPSSSMSNDVRSGVDASQLNQKFDRLITATEKNALS